MLKRMTTETVPFEVVLVEDHRGDGAKAIKLPEWHATDPKGPIAMSGLKFPMIDAALWCAKKPASFDEHMQFGGIIRDVPQKTTIGAA